MKSLSNKELCEIRGGFNLGLGLLVGAGVTFLIGVIDGFVRPLKCN